jgi:protein SCO1/2
MILRFSILLALVAVVATSCAPSEGDAAETVFDTIVSRPLPAADLGQSVGSVSLPDVSNESVAFVFRADPDQMLIVYFGFTSCPDICPTTLADLKSALTMLEGGASSVDVAMITVDPGRDTAEALVDYVQWFVPGAHALRTEDQSALTAAGEAFGASFSVVAKPDGGVEVLHTAYLYAVDDNGRVVVTWPFGAEPERIAADLEALLAG